MIDDELPFYQDSVLIETEIDELKMRWLVESVGEGAVRTVVDALAVKYPGRKPYVSTLLTRLRKRMPVEVYRPVNVPIFWVYFLALHDLSKVKIGMSGNWTQRACSFLPMRSQLEEVFDLDFSFALLVGPDKKEARRRETLAKHYFAEHRVESPWRDGTTVYGAGGHKEWFDGEILPRLFNFVADYRQDWSQTVIRSLRKAIQESVGATSADGRLSN
jgi:hypothetical protein